MNINVHLNPIGAESNGMPSFFSLGLCRMKGSFPAKRCEDLINKRLAEYGLNIKDDIVCSTTDGASVMVRLGELLHCFHQLCFAHGIHLSVVDVIYDRKEGDEGTFGMSSSLYYFYSFSLQIYW